MAYTQDDLDALQTAMARGAKRLKLNGEEVEFRDLSEMERLEKKMKADLGMVTTGRIAKIQTESGWR